MQLCELFLSLGEDSFAGLLRRVSISRLRTYQIFDHIKARTRLVKLNSEHLRKAAPRLWERLKEGDSDLASDLSQAILVSHLEMIIATLNFLGIPHEQGFFSKDADVKPYLTEGWQARAFEALQDKFPSDVLAFYLNHLAIETGKADTVFTPVAS